MNLYAYKETLDTNAAAGGVFWLRESNMALPSTFVGETISSIDMASLSRIEGECIVFVSSVFEAATRLVQDVRKAMKRSDYLVFVSENELSANWVNRLLSSGADDVVSTDDRQLSTALKKAHHHIRYRRTAAAELRDAYSNLTFVQNAIDQLPAPIFFKNRAGEYLGYNSAFLKMIGLAEYNVYGKTALELFPEELANHYHRADAELMDRGGTQIYEGRVKFADGTVRDVCFNKAVIQDDDGNAAGLAGAVLDISERKAYETALKELAERDPLTRAYNRRKFFEAAKSAITHAMVKGRPLTVAILDIDHFKQVNDTSGHLAGDAVLCALADLMMTMFNEPDCTARAGGEEFYLLLSDTDEKQAEERLEALRQAISELQVDTPAGVMSVTASIGFCALRDGDFSISRPISRADKALYCAKNGGRNRIVSAA
ncbi:diguanylate cyclase [Rhizobium sp. L1K21]|uniref:sensor domain-containing diguanylate cyclase n=1 Tax=Rhizobium sp. L1K21 TaxID=2954933 RepID=UPI00209306D6|nr:diguanylate cyclase [Rhizobium sp. L1K21]MCO6186556.1 diguanylate cyclase [Rhizobium sp. L1K21]